MTDQRRTFAERHLRTVGQIKNARFLFVLAGLWLLLQGATLLAQSWYLLAYMTAMDIAAIAAAGLWWLSGKVFR